MIDKIKIYILRIVRAYIISHQIAARINFIMTINKSYDTKTNTTIDIAIFSFLCYVDVCFMTSER